MDGGLVRAIRRSWLEAVVAGKGWRYDGIGWPRSMREVRPCYLGVAVIVALVIWGYVAIGPNGQIHPGRAHLHRTDFTVFPEAGAAFFDGRDPYRVANARGWHYLYPPLFALLVSPLALFDTESQVIIWFVVNVVLAFGCIAESRKLWRRVSGAQAKTYLWIAGLASLAVFLPVLDCMQAGQLGIGILYLLMLGFRLVGHVESRARWFLGGLILAFPASVKLVPSLPVAFLLLERWSAAAKPRSGPRPLAQAAILTAGVSTGALLFLLVIPASLIGWRANLDYLKEWHARVVTNARVGRDSNFNIHSYRNQSLANAVYLWDESTERVLRPTTRANAPRDHSTRIAHPEVRVLIGVIVAALVFVTGLLGRCSDRLDRATAYGLACAATLLVSPLSWGHYYMAELPAILLVPLWLARRGWLIPAKVLAAIPPALSWAYYVAQPYVGGSGLLGVGTAAWFLAACGLLIANKAASRCRGSRGKRGFAPGSVFTGRHHLSRRARAHSAHGVLDRPRHSRVREIPGD